MISLVMILASSSQMVSNELVAEYTLHGKMPVFSAVICKEKRMIEQIIPLVFR